ncbi:MAG: phosphatidylserine decarboxylase [Sulfurimonas sp.]|nr:phosphatidylserine decarboxylase [Sulfurimonas sp.]
MNNNLLPLAKEGWSYVAYSTITFLVLGFLDLEFLQFFSFLAILLFLYIFRNPERQMPSLEKGGIISPVDGVVTCVEELQGNDFSYKVGIESSYFDVSILRAPIESSVKSINILKGAKLSKFSDLSDKLNESIELVFEDADSNTIKIIHQNTLGFSDIKFDSFVSKKLVQGSRYGVMTKGITNIYFQKNTKLNVTVGMELKACESIIGYLY